MTLAYDICYNEGENKRNTSFAPFFFSPFFWWGMRKAECAFPHPLFLFCQIFFKKVLTIGLECGIMSPVPIEKHGSIAQLGEHLPYKQRVIGSSPIVPTIRGPVVQLVRTLACHARGQGFESPSGRHNTALAVCLCSSVGRAGD